MVTLSSFQSHRIPIGTETGKIFPSCRSLKEKCFLPSVSVLLDVLVKTLVWNQIVLFPGAEYLIPESVMLLLLHPFALFTHHHPCCNSTLEAIRDLQNTRLDQSPCLHHLCAFRWNWKSHQICNNYYSIIISFVSFSNV